MVFKGGDRVRLKDGGSDKTWIVYSVFLEMNEVLILGFKENETCHRLVNPAEIVSVDQNADIKQAIREVLLSEEFLKAFAAAWQKTPLVHVDEMKLAIEPITGSESEAYYLNKLKNGESK